MNRHQRRAWAQKTVAALKKHKPRTCCVACYYDPQDVTRKVILATAAVVDLHTSAILDVLEIPDPEAEETVDAWAGACHALARKWNATLHLVTSPLPLQVRDGAMVVRIATVNDVARLGAGAASALAEPE